ncbi:MAG: type II toxin-antitoxin system Phd/YefM family antitoxin [Gemmatimonadales bacterium]
MRAVGVRDLKNRLSEYLRAVKAGERILVTDRGQVIAELRQPSLEGEPGGLPPALVRLVREHGAIGLPNDPGAYPELERRTPDGTATRTVDELRGA